MKSALLGLLCPLLLLAAAPVAVSADPLSPLTVSGNNYTDPAGNTVKFWGVNLTAFYPDRATADATARNLAALQVNLVRPHHMLRSSKDWNPDMASGALIDYAADSRTFDPAALESFDYLNAALRREGIYLAMSAHNTRRFHPGDVGILSVSPEDDAAWSAAISELNGWHWKKSFDPIKALPVIDERAALLTIEFLVNLLKHRNPHTGLTYAEDHQWISLEVVNESSIEYAIVCKNRFPAYFEERLQNRWQTYAREHGIANPGDIYEPRGNETVRVRAAFFRELESAYYDRVRAAMESTGAKFPMLFSNLWRGDNATALAEAKSDVIENHAYIDPLLVRGVKDGISSAMKFAVRDKPYFIGEFNQAEGGDNIKAQSPYRTMLMLGAPAYAGLHDWSGIVWFAWIHGTARVGLDGWSTRPDRDSHLGEMVSDGMMLDHLRTAGLIHRRNLVAPSREPITLVTAAPYHAGDYHGLMDGKHRPRDGWQNIHGFRRTYRGDVPAAQASAPWLNQPAPGPVLTSDTGEIVKDTQRRQLTLAVSQAEGFSGFIDEATPAQLKHLALGTTEGFATVLLVAEDDRPLAESARLIVSRTALNLVLKETDTLPLTLRAVAPAGTSAVFKITRPASAAAETPLTVVADGSLELPATGWHEAEIHLAR